MAKIILVPGEQFEHMHSSSSVTRLDAGSVELQLPDATHILREGEEIQVPAQTSHRLVNIGSTDAVVYCGGHR